MELLQIAPGAAAGIGLTGFIIFILVYLFIWIGLPIYIAVKQSKIRDIETLPAVLLVILLGWIGVIIIFLFKRRSGFRSY